MTDETNPTPPTLPSSDSKSYSDESSSGHEGSSRTGYTGTSIQEELAADETKAVRMTKALVVIVLLVSATAAATVTAIFSKKEVLQDFESQFEDFAFEIDEVSQNNAKISHNVLSSLSASITSFAIGSKSNWPTFSVPHFDIRSEYVMETTGADLIAFLPVVSPDKLADWEEYAANNTNWLEKGWTGDSNKPTISPHVYPSPPPDATIDHQPENHPIVPVWQTHPVPNDPSIVNFDLHSNELFHEILQYVITSRVPILTEVLELSDVFGDAFEIKDWGPRSLFVYPVFDSFDDEDDEDNKTDHEPQVVGILTAVVPWKIYFENLLDRSAAGVKVVINNKCGDLFTFELKGPTVIFKGYVDYHPPEFDYLRHVTHFDPFGSLASNNNTQPDSINCHFVLNMYPSTSLYEQYNTKRPILLTCSVLGVFIFTTAIFMLYDASVQRRQQIVMDSAVRSNAIVTSLFPTDIRDRLFKTSNKKTKSSSGSKKDGHNEHGHKGKGGLLPVLTEAPKFRLKNFLTEGSSPNQTSDVEQNNHESKPIADLFPHTTVMFADIAGFTAWSSVREPSQVFTLLETVYGAFDKVARRRQIFKVETIGDCYVAVAGLPEPRQDHAVAMARYARDCLHQVNELTKKLETSLGPDTGDLTMRFGLHSGPVTAGVLRGDKSRFQLFGDTVNTAARMESTGKKNRIQISEETADLLLAAGKGHWFKARESTVMAKGKGELQTYWVFPQEGVDNPDYVPHHHKSNHSEGSDISDGEQEDDDDSNKHSKNPQAITKPQAASTKFDRMVGWNVDVLLRLLQQIVTARNAKTYHKTLDQHVLRALETKIAKIDLTALEQVTEFVPLPKFNMRSAKRQTSANSVIIDKEVIEQLQAFVTKIASLYRDNKFHNFEHASHVLMSVSKLLSRIVTHNVNQEDHGKDQQSILSAIHKRTYGIASDPLTQFAAVFSGLIHDVDHRGVPNFVLNQEESELAAKYESKSTAEQNSVDIAWNVLMEPQFEKFRGCIYTNEEELVRFHQVVINTVMATDIFDKEHAHVRRKRWENCFESPNSIETSDDINRKATIVIEHLIQASDVAHTMQHWQIYQKWNERLFGEMYTAYKMGRFPKDPSIGWYDSEISFFDNYIIPLAKKLEDCGVFGVSSDEYLNYALANRAEWAKRGKTVVASMKAKVDESHGMDDSSQDEVKLVV